MQKAQQTDEQLYPEGTKLLHRGKTIAKPLERD